MDGNYVLGILDKELYEEVVCWKIVFICGENLCRDECYVDEWCDDDCFVVVELLGDVFDDGFFYVSVGFYDDICLIGFSVFEFFLC